MITDFIHGWIIQGQRFFSTKFSFCVYSHESLENRCLNFVRTALLLTEASLHSVIKIVVNSLLNKKCCIFSDVYCIIYARRIRFSRQVSYQIIVVTVLRIVLKSLPKKLTCLFRWGFSSTWGFGQKSHLLNKS